MPRRRGFREQLVLLDDKVELDVPLDDLAVHEPDARKLIAFLKAMEFSTLTRRVAEYSQIDPSDVEADAANKSGASGKSAGSPPPPRAAGGDLFGMRTLRPRAASGKAQPPRDRPGQAGESNVVLTPHALAAARAEAARKTPVDRSKYRDDPHASTSSKPGSRGRTTSAISRSRPRRTRSIRCRRRCRALRWRWRRTTPATSRSPTSNPATAPACSTPGWRRTRSRQATRSTRCGRCWNPPGILKIGFNIKFNAVMLAQHGITLRNHDDAQLMSYALDAGRNSHGLDALAERWLGHAIISHGELTGSGKGKLAFDQVAIDKATAYSAEDADVILRLWRVLKPRLVAERMTVGL